MEKTTTDSSSLLWDRFPAFSEISSHTKLALGALSIGAAFYVAVRNMDGRSFSVGALTTAQKITSTALLALGSIFMATAALCQKSKPVDTRAIEENPVDRHAIEAIPFSNLMPQYLIECMKKSGLQYPYLILGRIHNCREEVEKVDEPIVFFKASNCFGIYLKTKVTNVLTREIYPSYVSDWILTISDDPRLKIWEIHSNGLRCLGSRVPGRAALKEFWDLENQNKPNDPGVFDLSGGFPYDFLFFKLIKEKKAEISFISKSPEWEDGEFRYSENSTTQLLFELKGKD